ncbi:MAG: methylthioribulose 1-phosphate dehydratase [Gammaproteobacteria bacterium]|nr:methylthioribulose 1-phosphate dehydratase [Gammaproteobacteria bacterium]
MSVLSGDPRLAQLIEFGRQFHARGWVPATGGNFSLRLQPDRIAITRSGVHKGELQPRDFLQVGLNGRLYAGDGKPSYETELHLMLYRRDGRIGCVLHTHSVANTVLSRRRPTIDLRGYEVMKVFPDVDDPERPLQLPVFANDQSMPQLAVRIDAGLRERDPGAFLLAGHGLYAWGADPGRARDRVEALELMLECELWTEGPVP